MFYDSHKTFTSKSTSLTHRYCRHNASLESDVIYTPLCTYPLTSHLASLHLPPRIPPHPTMHPSTSHLASLHIPPRIPPHPTTHPSTSHLASLHIPPRIPPHPTMYPSTHPSLHAFRSKVYCYSQKRRWLVINNFTFLYKLLC